MQVFGYIRVSTSEQASEGFSLDTQRAQIAGYCMMKGWKLGEVFVEQGVSGSIPLADRPEGKRLLGVIQKGDAIITPKLDRMFRSAADALASLEEIKAEGVSLHMLDLGGDVTGNGISKLIFTILSAVAENERDRLRERIRDAKRHIAEQGIFGGGKRPFGFDVVDTGRKTDAGKPIKVLVENAAEQGTLAKMRKMRSKKATYRSIGAKVGIADPKTVKRILDRINA